jgi:hypothetical protein
MKSRPVSAELSHADGQPLFFSDLNENYIVSTDFQKKSSKIKFRENPSSENRVVPYGWANGQTAR